MRLFKLNINIGLHIDIVTLTTIYTLKEIRVSGILSRFKDNRGLYFVYIYTCILYNPEKLLRNIQNI